MRKWLLFITACWCVDVLMPDCVVVDVLKAGARMMVDGDTELLTPQDQRPPTSGWAWEAERDEILDWPPLWPSIPGYHRASVTVSQCHSVTRPASLPPTGRWWRWDAAIAVLVSASGGRACYCQPSDSFIKLRRRRTTDCWLPPAHSVYYTLYTA